MTISEFLTDFKKVDVGCIELFKPYYAARQRTRPVPVYYQSIAAMMAGSDVFYKIVDKCLVILKRRVTMGNGFIMLQIAPISINSDTKKEGDIIRFCAAHNMSAKITEQEVSIYKLGKTAKKDAGTNIEYVYNANEFVQMEGAPYKHIRRIVNGAKKAGYKDIFNEQDIVRITEEWAKIHNHSQMPLLKSCITLHRAGHGQFHGVYLGDEFIGFSYVEQFGNIAVGVIGFRNYNTEMNDPNPILHYIDCLQIENKNRKVVYYTLGMGMNRKGLELSKEKLRPCNRVQIYKTQTAKSSAELYTKSKTIF